MTPADLAHEITQDPRGYGYTYSTGRWRGRQTICDILNLKHRVRLRKVCSTELMDAMVREELDALQGADYQWLFTMLQLSGDWDWGGETIQGEMRAIFEGSQTWARWEALASGRYVDQSRAEYLWGPGTRVTTEDVKAASAI